MINPKVLCPHAILFYNHAGIFKTMKTKKILTLILISLIVANANAQTDMDAFRYTGQSITGTARYSAMAGAFGAVGGDFTTLSHNPAGIGIYRSSEFTFTPSVYINSTTSNFVGNSLKSDKSNFNFGNIGLVYTNLLSKNPTSVGWKSWNFGIGYNRIENFHSRTSYMGVNPSSSMIDNFTQNSQGINYTDLDPFYEYLAYMTYLTNPDSLNNYYSTVSAGDVLQSRSDETRGAIGETVFTFGGNYSNKLYLGVTMGIKSVRYEYDSYYEEKANNPADTLSYFSLAENVTTHGSGIDFKFGMIYRPTDMLRFGVAIHTPTWFSMHDDFQNIMTSKFDGGFRANEDSPFGEFDYDLTTPFSVIGSAAVILGKQGIISADYQYTDFSDARFDSYGTTFSSVNNLIQKKYTGVHTARIGGELVLDDVSLRGGFAMSTSPIAEGYKAGSSDFSKKSFSGGIGFRPGRMFLDLGYVYTLSDQYYQPYTLEDIAVPGVKNRVISSNILLTVGVKF